ncbi:MAG: hypothetical protein LBK25_03085 [Treponema sp.]|nr:hypothetical protein [Treponema sp.]
MRLCTVGGFVLTRSVTSNFVPVALMIGNEREGGRGQGARARRECQTSGLCGLVLR